jgi:hypothetical protein
MRFNNFTIGNGESKNSIIDKINSNFSQIISFSSGPRGRIGEVGPTGYPGSAGPVGEIGPTGQRATEFEISPQQPLVANDYDYWVDVSPTGEFGVYRYSSGWSDTGVSFLEPGNFSVKTNIPTFTLPTEYSSIYFDGTDQANKFLTISDLGHTGGNVNPNYSKLLVSTEDQLDKPIFSFRKSNISGYGTPSFYWGSTGQNSSLKFKSNYEFKITTSSSSISENLSFLAKPSGLGATGNVLMYGRNLNTTTMSLIIRGPQRFTAARYFIFQSPSLSISQTKMILPGYFRNWGYFSCTPSASLYQPEGFLLSRGQTASNVDILRFSYGPTSGLSSNISNYLSVKQYQIFDGVDSSGNPIEKVGSSFIIGGTGDSAFLSWFSSNPIEGPTGPFAYHVKPANIFPSRGFGTKIPFVAGRYYLDASDITMYNKDVIVVQCTGSFTGGNNVHIKIPSAPLSIPNPNYYPLWGTTYCSEYRIILDYGSTSFRNRNIVGITWDQVIATGGFNNIGVTYLAGKYITFSGCKFIDIMYKYNTGDSQVYAYIKTCNGRSVAIKMTDYNAVSLDGGEELALDRV